MWLLMECCGWRDYVWCSLSIFSGPPWIMPVLAIVQAPLQWGMRVGASVQAPLCLTSRLVGRTPSR